MTTPRSSVVWRYLPHGSVKHALTLDSGSYVGHHSVALCGTSQPFLSAVDEWRGTGSQDEYDEVARLPECRRCARLLTKDESHA